MNPKEKANELVDKFTEPTKVPNIKMIWIEDILAAKQCALICVDKIIEEFRKQCHEGCGAQLFWQEVKLEIQNYEPT